MKSAAIILAAGIVLYGTSALATTTYVASGTMCRESPSQYSGTLKYSATLGAYNDGPNGIQVFCPAVQHETAGNVQEMSISVCDNGASSYISVTYWVYDIVGYVTYDDSITKDAHTCSAVVRSSISSGYIAGFSVYLPPKNGSNVSSIASYKVTLD